MREAGSALLIVLIFFLIVIAGAVFLFLSKSGLNPQIINSNSKIQTTIVTASKSASESTDSQNPFVQQSNPFSDTSYQNPFDNLK